MTLRIFRYFQGGSRWLQITCLEWKPREVVGVPTEYLTNFSARTRRLKLKTEGWGNTSAENTRLNMLKHLSYEDSSNEKSNRKWKSRKLLKNARWHLYGLSMWEQRQMEAIEWVCSLWTRRDEDKDTYIREHKLIQDRNLRLLRK